MPGRGCAIVACGLSRHRHWVACSAGVGGGPAVAPLAGRTASCFGAGSAGGAVCAALLPRGPDGVLFVPLLFGTFFLYNVYNGPASGIDFWTWCRAAVRASSGPAFVLFSHLGRRALSPQLGVYLSDRSDCARR